MAHQHIYLIILNPQQTKHLTVVNGSWNYLRSDNIGYRQQALSAYTPDLQLAARTVCLQTTSATGSENCLLADDICYWQQELSACRRHLLLAVRTVCLQTTSATGSKNCLLADDICYWQ